MKSPTTKNKTTSDAFINWLSKRVSPSQFTDLNTAYREISDFAIRRGLVKDSIWNNPNPQIIDFICSMIRTNRLFTWIHRSQMAQIDSVLRFISEYAHSLPKKTATSTILKSRGGKTAQERYKETITPDIINIADKKQNYSIKFVKNDTSSDNGSNLQDGGPVADIDTEPYRKTLLSNFKNGFRLGSIIEMNKFKRCFDNVNGYTLGKKSDQIEQIIKACGIEYKGRVYLTESMLSDEIKEELFTCIDMQFEEGASMVYFEALFHKFSDKFLDYRIYDSNMLRQYIANVACNKYVFEKNYLSLKPIDETNPIDEVRNCLKANVLPLQIEKLSKRLSNIPEGRIKTILSSNLEFVRNSKGEYFHADSFDVTDEELDDIATLINEEIQKNGFISGNELYNAVKQKFPYIYEKNAVFAPIGWRDALKYKFNGLFSFDGNVISDRDKSLSMSDVFSNFGKNRQYFSLQEVLQLVDSIGSKVVYFEALYENSARISYETFVRKDYVKFNIEDTDSVIDRFCTGDYVPIIDIQNFGIFPDASYPWNEYLLENYLSFHSEQYKLFHTGYNIKTVVGAVVKRSSRINDFDELLTRVIADSNVSLKKDPALTYLAKNGYIGRRSYKNIESILINARAIRNGKG